jgi:hypothetical protein
MASSKSPEDPGTYGLAKEPPPKRRYRPMKGFKASSEREPDEFDQPVMRRFLGTDPFPWMLATAVALWIFLGLATRAEPIFGVVLILAGFGVILTAQIWLYVSIFLDDADHGILSLCFGWYRALYLYMNPEVAWRPMLLSFVGLMMILTGAAVGLNGISPRQ